MISAASGPNSGSAGGNITVTTTVANQEPVAAGGFFIAHYLSTDNVITTSDIQLSGFRFVSALNGNTTAAPAGMSVTIPASTPAGTYYIGAIADIAPTVDETRERNNSRAGNTIAISVPPVAPSNLTATAASRSQINLSWKDNSNNEQGFKIERSTDNVNFTQIATVGGGQDRLFQQKSDP